MIVLARDVYLCKCATLVRPAESGDELPQVDWVKGGEAELALLDANHHSLDHAAELRQRLEGGEHWMVGVRGGRIVTYTWLRVARRIAYPYLPDCVFDVGPNLGYGYDAWTPPDLRGSGLRRAGFLEELRILRTQLGCAWELSFFVKHQLEGATRSLGGVGIDVLPLWRIQLGRDRALRFTCLVEGDNSAKPAACAPAKDG